MILKNDNPDKIIFGNNIELHKVDKGYICYQNGEKKNYLTLDELAQNNKELIAEARKKQKTNNRTNEYIAVDKLEKLLGAKGLKAPSQNKIDIQTEKNGKIKYYSIKTKTSSKNTLLNYGANILIKHKVLSINDKTVNQIKKTIPQGKIISYLFNNYKLIPEGFFIPENLSSNPFADFLLTIDPVLPGIFSKLKILDLEAKNKKNNKRNIIKNILTPYELDAFKKFILYIPQGLTSSKFPVFDETKDIYEAILDSDFCLHIYKYNEDYVDKIMDSLVLDTSPVSKVTQTVKGEKVNCNGYLYKDKDGNWYVLFCPHLRYTFNKKNENALNKAK